VSIKIDNNLKKVFNIAGTANMSSFLYKKTKRDGEDKDRVGFYSHFNIFIF